MERENAAMNHEERDTASGTDGIASARCGPHAPQGLPGPAEKDFFASGPELQIRDRIAPDICTMKRPGTMKKTMLVLCPLLLILSVGMLTDNDRAVAFGQLPPAAQRFIESFRPAAGVAYALREREFFEVEYKVVLTNGVRMKFRRNGSWKRIDCRYGQAPRQAVPPQVARRIGELYPGARITDIDRGERTT